MSNCVEFLPGGDTLVLPNRVVDVERLQALVYRSMGVSSDTITTMLGRTLTDDEVALYHAWWFMPHMQFTDKRVSLQLGHGHSIHTWRDLKGTMETISKFMLEPWTARFICTDESDGFKKAYVLDITVGPDGLVKLEERH